MEQIKFGDIVRHFKREFINDNELTTNKYLYVVKEIATHTETGKQLVVYQALYPPFQTWARPIEDFCGLVDKKKYPQIIQKYRFEKYEFQPNYDI